MKTLNVRNTETNRSIANVNNLRFTENGKMLEVKVSDLEYPYLQVNVKKIKKAIGF